MDSINIKGLEVFAHHGVYREENVLGQKFVVDVSMQVSTREAGRSDDIRKSVNYGSVCDDIQKVMKNRNYKLIETVAEEIADMILLTYDDVRGVNVTVKKPWAPVMVHVDTVSVSISRKKHTAYLGLGSNIGDRESYLDMAIDELNKDKYTKVTRVSDFIETEPYGGVEQDDFLNGCLEIETLRTPEELLRLVNGIEKEDICGIPALLRRISLKSTWTISGYSTEIKIMEEIMDRERMMKNVAEIFSRGAVEKNLPAWVNMRHAWKASDAARDRGLEYPANVVQIKNLDYKKELDEVRFNELIETWDKGVERNIIFFADSGDAADVDSASYTSNSYMDICVPISYMTDENRKYPVIVSVHGGGWFYGDKELYSHYCCLLAEHGYVVVNFNYRLSPQNKYPAAIEDVAYLIRYIHENAQTLGIDMDNFYMVGDSAGAQLTANYCIIASNSDYRAKLDFFTYDLLPKKVCLNCGAYKMAERNDNISAWYLRNDVDDDQNSDGKTSSHDKAEKCESKKISQAYAVTEEQYKLFMDQLDYINADFPEAYLMYSVNDDLASHTKAVDEVLNKVGVAHITKAYGQNNPDSGHIFHMNMYNPEGILCNEDECAFMK